MSLEIETGNKGIVDGFGYITPDMQRIGLGEMPAMPLDQFAQLAVDAILAAIPAANQEDIARLRKMVGASMQIIDKSNIRVRKTDSPLDLPEDVQATNSINLASYEDDSTTMRVQQLSVPKKLLHELFSKTSTPKQRGLARESLRRTFVDSLGVSVDLYEKSPFEVAPDGTIAIQPHYTGINIAVFGGFALQVLRGGWMGWDDDLGIPQAAYRNLERLEGALAKI